MESEEVKNGTYEIVKNAHIWKIIPILLKNKYAAETGMLHLIDGGYWNLERQLGDTET